jgi:nitronate monooxygenase
MPTKGKIDFANAAGVENKRGKDLWAAGQGVGSSTVMQSIAEIVDELTTEYQLSLATMVGRQKQGTEQFKSDTIL